MATYTEIRDLFNDSVLKNRVEVAVIIAANGLADNASNNAWVSQAYNNPKAEAGKALMAVLAANNGLSVAAIQGANDAAIQGAVDTAVATLVKALAGV
tara:strand:+ start:392 stop:685 length:294 start_codon:yes stop_codon:yes gene_type:complete